MSEFLAGAGWGVWPTLVFGIASLGLASAHAVKPRPQAMPLIVGTGLATLFAGALGFVTGVIACFTALASVGFERGEPLPNAQLIAFAGISEASANIVVALALAMLVSLVAGVGSYRARLQLVA
jgi:hypothetical protein